MLSRVLSPTLSLGVLLALASQVALGGEAGHGPVASKPEAVQVEGVPPIPSSLLEDLRRYQDIRPARFLDWRPQGGILISKRLTKVHQLYRVEEPKGKPIQLTGGDEPIRYGCHLPNGGLLFSRGEGGNERYQIHWVGPGARVARRLTDGQSRNLMGPPDRAGKRIVFSSTLRNGRDADLYVLKLKSDARPEILLEVDNETWAVTDWSPDGSRVLLVHFLSVSECYGHVLDLDTGVVQPLPAEVPEKARRESKGVKTAGKAPPARRGDLRFGPGAKSVYMLTNARGEFLELARLDLKTMAYSWLTEDIPWDVEDLEIAPDGKHLAFAVNVDGASRLYLLDLETVERDGDAAARRARREIPLTPCQVDRLRFSPDSRSLGFSRALVSSPEEAWTVPLDGGEPLQWTSANPIDTARKAFPAPEVVRYESFDGRKIPAFVFLPPVAARREGVASPLPVVITIHGGPESQFRPGFNVLRQYLVGKLGVAVVAPNVRGSTGYGKTYTKLDNGALREDSVKDIGALLDWIADDKRLDADRVAVLGGSYGGYMVLSSLIHFGERIRAGVDVVGISDFRTFLENTSPYRRELRRAEYGDESDPRLRAFFEKISPARRIHQLRSALLVVHGANDPRVPLSEARQIVDSARSSGQPVWTLYASNEGHGFRRRENSDYLEAVIVTFLKRFLLGEAPESKDLDDARGKPGSPGA